MPKGYFTFVLHSHLPYVRAAGQWPHGEAMLHQAAAETYLPLLNALYDLRADGSPCRLTLGITPILAEQLADKDVLAHFEHFLLAEQQRAEEDGRRFEKAEKRAGRDSDAAHLLYLARFYIDWYENLWQSFRERFQRDIVGALRLLQEEGWIEIITSAATHGYLPLLARDSAVYGQLRTGVASYLRHFGRLPRGVWLPECGYRPAVRRPEDGQVVRPGLEALLADLNLRYTFVDTYAVEQGPQASRPAGEAGSSYGGRTARRSTATAADEPSAIRSVLRPYHIRGFNVAVYGRDGRAGRQVWSASEGYPGDFAYREFHRQYDRSGLRYWRITGDEVDLGQKALYDPYNAFHRAYEHAAHFVEMVRRRLSDHFECHGRPGIIVAAYDTELFGHWWFEGVAWMKQVLGLLRDDPDIALTTADEYLKLYPPEEEVVLPESSWGQDGDHSTWLNAGTDWMWPLLHRAERRLEDLVARFPDAAGTQLEVLKQTARELLLLQSSDWPFLIHTGQAAEYAAERFRTHLERFERLAALAEKPQMEEDDLSFLQTCQHLDNPFLNIDYRAWRPVSPE